MVTPVCTDTTRAWMLYACPLLFSIAWKLEVEIKVKIEVKVKVEVEIEVEVEVEIEVKVKGDVLGLYVAVG